MTHQAFGFARGKLLRRQDMTAILVDPNEEIEWIRSVFSAANIPDLVIESRHFFDPEIDLAGLDVRLAQKVWDTSRRQIVAIGDPGRPFFVTLCLHLTEKFDSVFTCPSTSVYEARTWMSLLRLIDSNVAPITLEQLLFELKCISD